MNSEDFVRAIERHVKDAAIGDTLASLKAPAGRRIPPDVRARSDWYNGLSEIESTHVEGVVKAAVHAAVFGLLAVLDGARTIDDGSGQFELVYVAGQRILLNPQSVDLHDMLSA